MKPAGPALGEFELLVLMAVLRLGESANGSAVRDEIQARTSRRVARGAVYVTLDRLQDKGLLSSRLGERVGERGARPTRWYRTTAFGRRAVRQAVADVTRMRAGIESMLPVEDL